MLSTISFMSGKRRILLVIIALGFCLLGIHLFSPPGSDLRETVDRLPLPSWPKKDSEETLQSAGFHLQYEPYDKHPISLLIQSADQKWREYEDNRSMTFQETVSKYRRKYGRHPPPGFDIWYKYARTRNVHNIDDFEQIMDDLRPFWGVEPHVIRALAAHMWERRDDGIDSIHIRKHKVKKISSDGWRITTFATLVESFIDHLPDMDLAMNTLDQPRVLVDWYDMQTFLNKEHDSRQMPPEAMNSFTANMTGLLDLEAEKDGSPFEDPEWFLHGGEQYMDIANKACPPKSHARGHGDTAAAEAAYKTREGGVIKNFNISSDLCTVGPEIHEKHGFLFSPSSISATHKLVPVFGECKVNINSDILFPANMYWRDDERYEYDGKHDVKWSNKTEKVLWRGATSGGVQRPENWRRMHRQRLVVMLNATETIDKDVRVVTEQPEAKGEYENFRQFHPESFLERVSDVGFTDMWGCFPEDCSFYFDFLAKKPPVALPQQFESKYLLDVDGHSFSGRWRAFLQSKSLGIKATIFREWHDSRLFAWRHFVPMDNRFDDIYTILTYFIGFGEGNPSERRPGEPYVARHDSEAKRIALQGREWANKVLRREDMEVYMFRLLLEYGRILDDNRDRIGYSGDGTELDKFDSSHAPKGG